MNSQKRTKNTYFNDEDEEEEDQYMKPRNSNGSMLTEEFKRSFIKKLMMNVRGKSSGYICNLIQQEADRIHVYPNEVSCWLAIYKIVFKIE